jgi:steroid 5-alpha reductase family enzyme
LVAASAALVVEATADRQKTTWRSDPANKGKFCGTGLFSVVRYPNYSAEIAFWSALSLATGPVLVAAPWALVAENGASEIGVRSSGSPPGWPGAIGSTSG